MEEIEKGMRPLLKQVEDPEIKKQFYSYPTILYFEFQTILSINYFIEMSRIIDSTD